MNEEWVNEEWEEWVKNEEWEEWVEWVEKERYRLGELYNVHMKLSARNQLHCVVSRSPYLGRTRRKTERGFCIQSE